MSEELRFCNILFVAASSILVYKPIKRIMEYTSQSIADYIIAIVFIFNCLPIFLDIVLGVPVYNTWFGAFQEVAAKTDCSIIYNSYIFFTLSVLCSYAKRQNRIIQRRQRETQIRSEYGDEEISYINECSQNMLARWRTPLVDAALMIFPFIYAFQNGGVAAFIGYTTLVRRGIATSVATSINQFIMVGVLVALTRYFSRERSFKATVFLVAYLFLAMWINGKRYIVVTILIMVVYLYQIRHTKHDGINLKVALPVMAIFLLIFCGYYILSVKVTSTQATLYGNLRIDFGREDVTKFVINKVLLKNESILNYPGETFLSAVLMLVPRAIWPTKPYPHYRYLTAAIYGTDLLTIPAGMTPSLFEMSICNFGWFGMLVTVIILLSICKFGDRRLYKENKLLVLIISITMLTQSLDASFSLLLYAGVNSILSRTRIVWGR